MTITSTKFQQNVGAYFDMADKLVEKGEELIVQKKRPNGYDYKIVPVGNKNRKRITKRDTKEILKKINESNIKINNYGESALEYQNRVRD